METARFQIVTYEENFSCNVLVFRSKDKFLCLPMCVVKFFLIPQRSAISFK